MDAIAQRAFVVAHAVYFYFPNKRAVVDRLIQQAFTRHVPGRRRRTSTARATPRRELRTRARARRRASSTATGGLLLLAAQLHGRAGEHLPAEWEPYIPRFVERAEARIARDQERGIAPADIPPRLAAQALLAMVENHITREIVLNGGDAHRVDPRARRAVVARGLLAAVRRGGGRVKVLMLAPPGGGKGTRRLRPESRFSESSPAVA